MTRSTPRRLPQLLALPALALTLLLSGAATSQAAYSEWGCTLPGGTGCTGERHSMRAVSVWNETGTGVGAAGSPTGSMNNLAPGGFVWGPGYTCKGFDGSLIYPIIQNAAATTLRLTGFSSFGERTEGC